MLSYWMRQGELRTFLRFTTGSDLLTVPSIFVSFNFLDGAMRRPVAPICGPLLELPTTYLVERLTANFIQIVQFVKQA